MPDPTRGFSKKTGMCSKYDLPTKPGLRVLEHLMRPGEPRLFSGIRDGRLSSSLSNAADAVGFPTRVDPILFIYQKWIRKDPEWTGRSRAGITAYQLTDAGREAVAQYHARERYQRETVELARRILAECRTLARARQ